MTSENRKSWDREAALEGILRAQFGVITVEQATQAGVSSAGVTRRVESRTWERVLPGVYRHAMFPADDCQAALAAVLWAEGETVVSHRAAGALWGVGDVSTARVHLWVPPPRHPRSRLVVVHRGAIESIDRRMIGPIPVTSVPRTLIDLAGDLDDESLYAAVEDAIHRGLTTPTSIERRLDSLGGKGRRGAGVLREILLDRGSSGAAASRLEVKIWRMLRAAGLRPVRQYAVRVCDHTYRIDAALPEWRLGVEGVGDAFHHTQLHRRRDHTRLADLASVAWRIIPVTWDDITAAPDAVIARAMRAIASAA